MTVYYSHTDVYKRPVEKSIPESLDVMRPLIVESHWRAEIRLGALRLSVRHQKRELVRLEAMARAETASRR